jgi:GTP-binding protein
VRKSGKDTSSDSKSITSAVIVGSFPAEKDCPQSALPEYAFIGRSNVGKSSLINMLLGRRDLARTSKSPGKTQHINLYLIDEAWQIADLPGYGYAKVSQTARKRWQKMIEQYMVMRDQLVTAFVLIDLRHPLQDIDREFINWLGERQVPFVLIYTKADKLKPRERQANKKRIDKSLLEYWSSLPPAFITSATTREGRAELLEYIAQLNRSLVSKA